MTNEDIKKQLEKQLEILSELSQEKELSIADHLAISAEIRAVCNQLFEFQNVRWNLNQDMWSY